jgi:methylmalonyl-CoA mutase
LTDSVAVLLDRFAPATAEVWRAAVEKTLKGQTPESLISPGPDSLAIQPLYAPRAKPRTFQAGRGWRIGADVGHPQPAKGAAAIGDAFAGGAETVIIAIDNTAGEGVEIGSAASMEAMLADVPLDVSAIGLDAGFLGLEAAGWLSAAAKGSPRAPLAFHFDPLSAMARSGASPGPIEAHLAAAADLAVELAATHPAGSLFLASGRVVHEAGGSPAGELAFALASALAYAKAMGQAGLASQDALERIVVGLSIDGDPLISIAKLRAARMIWGRMSQACGASLPARIEARSSRRMLTRADAWTNLVRLTAAGVAGAVGGADTIVLGAFTDALGAPTAFGRRMARNIQLILRHEGQLGAVSDPVAGSGAFESLSSDLARAAWAKFNAIEAAGGAAAALAQGVIAAEVGEAKAKLAADIAEGAMRIVGVTDYRAPDDRPAPVEAVKRTRRAAPEPRLPGSDSRCSPLEAITLEALAA